MLVELAEVVLKNNVFTFGKKTLKQIRGTAIGTKFAPLYSVLFMAELEEEILREVELKPYLWWWFIDDIFFIWEYGEEKLKEFIDVLNKKHPTIKFTAEWSKTQINFLDVTVYLENGNIKTDLYVKPTDIVKEGNYYANSKKFVLPSSLFMLELRARCHSQLKMVPKKSRQIF